MDERYADVVNVTDGVRNPDDVTGLPAVRHRPLAERAQTRLAQGHRAKARSDLERVLAEDSDYPGLADALTRLG